MHRIFIAAFFCFLFAAAVTPAAGQADPWDRPSRPSRPARAPAAPPGTPGDVYDPVIVLGNAKSPNKLVFVWGSNQRSADIFKSRLLPILSDNARSRNFKLVLIQQFLVGPDDVHGPGALMFCADRSKYPTLALTYLRAGIKLDERAPLPGDPERHFIGNPSIVEALQLNGINLRQCIESRALYRRIAFTIGLTDRFRTLAHTSDPPALFFRNRALDPDDGSMWDDIGKGDR